MYIAGRSRRSSPGTLGWKKALSSVFHPKWGESIRAIVVIKKDSHLTQADIIDHCRQNLSSHKKPTSVIFVDELPKGTFGGKVLKRVLRDSYGQT